ncbi:MAG: hypothetical protein IT169_18075, partial [Bryobacterales bacterium]|nr:hypothetical protein [Bryobacterales bacterium]
MRHRIVVSVRAETLSRLLAYSSRQMSGKRPLWVAALAGIFALAALAAAQVFQGFGPGGRRAGFDPAQFGATRGQTRWAQYESEMQNPTPDPPDAWVERDFVFARLRFRAP